MFMIKDEYFPLYFLEFEYFYIVRWIFLFFI